MSNILKLVAFFPLSVYMSGIVLSQSNEYVYHEHGFNDTDEEYILVNYIHLK